MKWNAQRAYATEEKAKQILAQWALECRRRNPSGRVELKDVSNWAEIRCRHTI